MATKMSISSTEKSSGFLQSAARRALYQQVDVELAFRDITRDSSRQSGFLVDIAEISNNRVVFFFPDTLPGVYTITDIYFHDGGLLDYAGAMKYAYDDVELPRRVSRFSGTTALPDTGSSFSEADINRHLPVNDNPHARTDRYDRYESWVVVFVLGNGVDFADIIYALSTGDLCIKIRVKDSKNGIYRLLTNDPDPTLGHPGWSGQTGVSALQRPA